MMPPNAFLYLLALLAACLSTLPTDATAESLETFQSPTGNIHCLISTGPQETPIAFCEVKKFNGKPPPAPADCELDWVPGASVDATGKVRLFSCQGDTNIDPEHKTLAYGDEITHGGFTCRSATTGVTCTTKGGRGFLVSREVIKKL